MLLLLFSDDRYLGPADLLFRFTVCTAKEERIEKRKKNGPLAIEKDERVQEFLQAQRERLLWAIKRFACSKDVKEVADDLDPAQLGIVLLDGFKAQLDSDELFAAPKDDDATDALKPVEPVNRVRDHINGRHKSVA